MKFYCSKCKYSGKIYTKHRGFYLRHIKRCEESQYTNKNNNPQQIKFYRCQKCLLRFENRKTLYLHFMTMHQKGRWDVLPNLLWGEFHTPWENVHGIVVDWELKQVYEAHISIYLESHRIGTVQSIYNFHIQNNFTLDDIWEHLNNIHNSQINSFKLNVMFGLILKSVRDDKVVFYE